MIKRTNDFSLFEDKEFLKIAAVVNKKEAKKLYNTYPDVNMARIAKKELEIKGYKTELYQKGNEWQLYLIENLQKISLEEAEKSGAFKKLAWGRYVFQRESSLEMHKYPFDDGSIWRVITDVDGKQYLVKEYLDDNEEEVVRYKKASLTKEAETFDFVTPNNFNNVFKLIFNIVALNQIGTNFLNDLYSGNAVNLQNYFIEKLNEDINEYVEQIASAQSIQPNSPELDEIKQLIKEKFDNNLMTSITDIDKTIDDYVLEKQQQEQEQGNNGMPTV